MLSNTSVTCGHVSAVLAGLRETGRHYTGEGEESVPVDLREREGRERWGRTLSLRERREGGQGKRSGSRCGRSCSETGRTFSGETRTKHEDSLPFHALSRRSDFRRLKFGVNRARAPNEFRTSFRTLCRKPNVLSQSNLPFCSSSTLSGWLGPVHSESYVIFLTQPP